MTEITNEKNFEQIVNALKNIDNVEAVALGGSRATGNNDPKSDYDIYVYCTEILSEGQRAKAITPLCKTAEICNHYWESEDNCIMNSGTEIDIIYRDFNMIKKYLDAVVQHCYAFNSYTTCFWHNIITCKILFDKTGNFSEIQKKYTVSYPDKLKQSIVNNGRNLLSGKLPSYDKQIKKAAERGDLVSVHHRITEFLASYFDIIFALNKLTHPGEKRLVALCKKECKLLPADFEENINALLSSVTTGGSYDIACQMIENLDRIIDL